MGKLINTGRLFYGISIAGLGLLTIYYKDFPYMLIPPKHSGIPGFSIITYTSGALLFIAGACIALGKRTRPVSLFLGTVLLLVFCFYHVPYEFLVSSNYMQFGDWENAAKELTLSAGAFVIAGCASEINERAVTHFFAKLIPLGTILYSLTIISYGIDHFLFAKEAADYVPSWVPWHLFWIYFCGTALLGSGLAIILKIRTSLVAALLGTMIIIWFVILHVPRIIVSPVAYLGSEISSALLALAYSGISFVISGAAGKNKPVNDV